MLVEWLENVTREMDDLMKDAEASTLLPLPPGWVEYWDPGSGLTYYYNERTGENRWDNPLPQDDPLLTFRKKRFQMLHQVCV